MKYFYVQNGVGKTILQPETELERLQLLELAKVPVEISQRDNIQVGDHLVVGAFIIEPSKPRTV